jgi:DNA-directed RNA polymerase sigma subunit (sigma70/sigma32)
MAHDTHHWLKEHLALMTPTQQRIVRLRFGLDGATSHTLAEVARALGMSIDRMRREEANALRRIRRGR